MASLIFVDCLPHQVGERVAIIGAGGIGFDVAEFLAHGADRLPPPKAPAQLPAVSSLLGGAEHLSPRTTITTAAFLDSWGIDATNNMRGGLLNAAGADAGAVAGAVAGAAAGAATGAATGVATGAATGAAFATAPSRQLYLLQRKKGKHGGGLGKTTGWIHRESLKKEGVNMIGGVSYEKVDDEGLHLKGEIRRDGR